MSGLEILTEIDSTQSEIDRRLQEGTELPLALAARSQTTGRGRFSRDWLSPPEASLSLSIPFPDHTEHPKPWLLGMAVAVAGATAIHCRLQWPNDLMIGPLKAGGVLTELLPDKSGKTIPVVGIGINLSQPEFPNSIAHRATSLRLARGRAPGFEEVAEAILRNLAALPPVADWSDLATIWMNLDETPGKIYRLPTGEEATALGIGPRGELICAVEGETVSVMAAEAVFGQ